MSESSSAMARYYLVLSSPFESMTSNGVLGIYVSFGYFDFWAFSTSITGANFGNCSVSSSRPLLLLLLLAPLLLADDCWTVWNFVSFAVSRPRSPTLWISGALYTNCIVTVFSSTTLFPL